MTSIIDHLNDRFLNVDKYIGIHTSNDVATFMLFNLSGQIVGYQQYRPAGDKRGRGKDHARYFTHLSDGVVTAWGMDTINVESDVLIVTEGIFGACRFHNKGYAAIATLCNNPKGLMNWLSSVGCKTISICDGDSAGRRLAKYSDKSILLKDGEYIDEMTSEEFDTFCNTLLQQV